MAQRHRLDLRGIRPSPRVRVGLARLHRLLLPDDLHETIASNEAERVASPADAETRRCSDMVGPIVRVQRLSLRPPAGARGCGGPEGADVLNFHPEVTCLDDSNGRAQPVAVTSPTVAAHSRATSSAGTPHSARSASLVAGSTSHKRKRLPQAHTFQRAPTIVYCVPCFCGFPCRISQRSSVAAASQRPWV